MNGFSNSDLLTKGPAASSITGGQPLTRTNDTNVTLTLGGTPLTALLVGVSLTLGWTGTLADGRIASAATWNSKQDALTISTGLTNAANTITNDVLTGKTGGQTWIGGTAAGDTVTIKSTTGNGTTSVAGISFSVGNNGGTTAVQIFNSGNFNVGNASNTNARIARFGQDTAFVDIGSNQGSTTIGAIYFNAATPSGTNYALQGTSTTTQINGPTTSIDHRIANNSKYLITNTAHTFTVAGLSASAITQYSFTGVAANTQTASTEVFAANFNFAQNLQHATGNYASQRDVLFQARSHSAVAASTITDAATLAISSSPFSNTNATITNSHGILVQTANVQTAGAVTNSFGITVNAMTGGTNNYAGQFIGGNTLFAATVTGYASIRLPHGTAPTTPVDGDIWTTTAGIYVRINGATVGPLN